MSPVRYFSAAIFVALIALISLPTSAQTRRDASIGSFYGHWQGNALSESETSTYFQLTARDLDVHIQGADAGGFRINWTTVRRQKGDPKNPTIEKKATELLFAPTNRPNVWRQQPTSDPLDAPYAWANLIGNILSITVLAIAPDGTYEFQIYKRIITGGAMELHYASFKDGEKSREAKGRLVKTGAP